MMKNPNILDILEPIYNFEDINETVPDDYVAAIEVTNG